jgi:hypothetical protein
MPSKVDQRVQETYRSIRRSYNQRGDDFEARTMTNDKQKLADSQTENAETIDDLTTEIGVRVAMEQNY